MARSRNIPRMNVALMLHQGVRTKLHGENALSQQGEGYIVGILRRALSRSASFALAQDDKIEMELCWGARRAELLSLGWC